MKNRIIALVLLCTLTLSLFTGCGNTNINVTAEGRTLFIYMCGSNLETRQGLASKNIDELLSADAGDLNIVIQTGGAQTWRHHGIDNTANQRYEIKDGKLKLLETLEQKNMGEAETLTNFLKWGQKKYPTDHNMLILWDHGGGSAKGVCFDENYSFDPLTLTELKSAFESAKFKTKFDIIGFDACLMASLETAAMVKDYAKYMIASEEIVPAGGWDYKAAVKAFASEKSEKKIGKQICDSFIQKCKNKGIDYSTLSLFDLSQTNYMLKQFSALVKYLDNYVDTADYSLAVMNAINSCEKFGGDNSYQGASNMLDILDFIDKATSGKSKKESKIKIDADSFVLYSVNSGNRKNGGISFYYPMVYNEQEIKDYISLGVVDYYNEFLSLYYLDLPETTIEYKDKGSVTDDGAFSVTLTPESFNYLSHIDFVLMNTDKNGTTHTLCKYNDIRKDWDNLNFDSNFRGVSIALDGHRLFCSAVNSNSEYISFVAPVKVNDKKTNLRFAFVWDKMKFNNGYFKLTGLWNGYDENGLPDNEIIQLKEGDKVQLITDIVVQDGRVTENYSDEFTIGKNGGEITELPLDGKEYQYVFVATDIFGNKFYSDTATFEMTKSYEELLKNPLPDETFAAKVSKIRKTNANDLNTIFE